MGTIWFRAPIGTLQLLQLYETDGNDVTMAMVIFTRLPDISINRNRERSASSSFVLASYEYQSHHDTVDRNFACLTFRFEANLGSSGT